MKIVYGTDGSTGSVITAEFLARLALTPEDRIDLVAVNPPPAAEREHRAFEVPLRALAGCRAAVTTQTRHGSPADEIVKAAAEQQADLIALGAMGASALTRYFIGSVAERVLRHAPGSVLVCRPVRHELKRALVAVDASRASARVLERTRSLPLPLSTELRLATVLPSHEGIVGVAPLVWSALSGELESILQSAVREAEGRLRDQVQGLRGGGRPVTAEILRGEPTSRLISAADTQEIDLLILGSTGEGGMDRYLLGSVSERVARHAHCSVLVAR